MYCIMQGKRIVAPLCFKSSNERFVHRELIQPFVVGNEQNSWFQEDGETFHTSDEIIDWTYLPNFFPPTDVKIMFDHLDPLI